MQEIAKTPAAGARAAPRRHPWLLVAAAAGTLLAAPSRWGSGFAMQPGRTRKQLRGTLHNKDRLPTLYELPLEEPEPEPAPKGQPLEHRVPYTLNIVTQFPHGANPNWKYIEKKIMHALQNTEDMVQHVDVRVLMLEHFHREKPRRSPGGLAMRPGDEVDDLEAAAVTSSEDRTGAKALDPFQLKVKVDLRNHRQVILSNPEKHAQPTLTEAVDHTADLLRKLMREEKERDIRLWRKRHQHEKEDLRLAQEEAALAAEEEEVAAQVDDDLERLADAQAELLYRAVEAAGEDGAAEEAAQAARGLGAAVAQAEEAQVEKGAEEMEGVEAKTEEKPEAFDLFGSLRNMLLGGR